MTAKPLHPHHSLDDGHQGFTLIELLAVLAIMGILLFLVVPVTASLQEAGNLAYSGQVVVDELAVARQYAASGNQTVYVRFIIPSNSTYQGYTAIQIWRADPANPGQFLAMDRADWLAAGVEISANPALSPLVSTLVSGTTGTMPAGSATPGKFVYFAIRPDGNVSVPNPPAGVNVATATNAAYQFLPSYFLTLLPVRDDASTTLPKNYVTLQVNPDTASTQIFRP